MTVYGNYGEENDRMPDGEKVPQAVAYLPFRSVSAQIPGRHFAQRDPTQYPEICCVVIILPDKPTGPGRFLTYFSNIKTGNECTCHYSKKCRPESVFHGRNIQWTDQTRHSVPNPAEGKTTLSPPHQRRQRSGETAEGGPVHTHIVAYRGLCYHKT